MRPTSSISPRTRPTFAEAFDPKNNAFGFLRLFLAVLVVFSHSFPVGGFGIDALEALTKGRHTIGLVAVGMFFVLSGFLITRSAASGVSVARFLWHRFLRIFPGYWVCLVVCGFVFAPYFAYVEYGSFLRIFSAPSTSPQAYILHNGALFHSNGFTLLGVLNVSPQSIAGLLSRNPFPYQINGSLWTLPFEVACYLGVAALALCGIIRRARLCVAGMFGVLLFLHAYSYFWPRSFSQTFACPGLSIFLPLGLCFSVGSVCFLYREKIPSSFWAFAACVGALVASLPLGWFGVAAPIFLSYAFLWLAFNLPFSSFDAKGDYSYGTYIYAFPVQQTLALSGVQEDGWIAYFAWSLVIIGALAYLSYRLVEAPCLRWKNLNARELFARGISRSSPPSIVEAAAVISVPAKL
ncbi:MAG TPA: acyltransferase [Chthoniobacterales bacterium]|nr:acyltransferase [Chthoniobacterales bacterium]